MRHFGLYSLAIVLTLGSQAFADEQAVERIRQDVEFLASQELEGRLTGTPGAQAAAEYLAGQLVGVGAVPLAGSDSYLLPFEFVAGADDLGSSVTRSGEAFGGPKNVSALAFSESTTSTAEVVFVGYGLKIPEGQDFPYNSYAGLDVEGKIALALRYFPEDADAESKKIMARYSGLRYKALQAREAGAVGLLVVSGPNSPNAGKTLKKSTDAAFQGSGIVAATISGKVADWLLRPSGKTLKEVQDELDTGNPHVAGFVLTGDLVTVGTQVERVRRQGNNVVGVLPASVDPELPGSVLVGAHFDHLGRGESGNSLAGSDEKDAVHAGADDNASGVAAVLELAEQWAQRERARDVVLAFWSGEELGLLGSQAFSADETALESVPIGYLNFDMVGQLRDDNLVIQAVGSSPAWSGWIESANVPIGLNLTLQEDPYLPTDSTSFHNAGIPSLSFFTGSHEYYHRPSDLPDTLNYDGIETVVGVASGVLRRLVASAEPVEFVQVERKQSDVGARDGVRAYTGTIPDYASDVVGLRLSGVMAGGPAEAGGLVAGDVIVEFAGQEIQNIYDYTYALDAVKIGEEIAVVYERDGERGETVIVPTARE